MTAVRQTLVGLAGLRGLIAAPGWPRHLAALGALAGAVLLIFARDVGGMVAIWWTSSNYGHILFIPPLIAWLVHMRLPALRQLEPVAWVPGLAWLGGGAVLWLLGDAASLAVLRHAALIVMMQGAVAATLGPSVSRALLFPLFYAFFMVPVGSELEPALQLLTARLAMALLSLVGIPAHLDGIFITIPGGLFKVAEACSGANFLIAMCAYGVLVCHLCFRSWFRRAIFLIFALGTCLLANGVRAFGTIYVAHLTTVDAAAGFDHIVYGWLFFALVMALVMAAAWLFFERRAGDVVLSVRALSPGPTRGRPLSPICAAALAILVVGPAWSLVSAQRNDAPLGMPTLPDVPGWRRVTTPAAYPWKPRYDGADHLAMARYVDASGRSVDLAVATFRRQAEGRELIGFGQGAAAPDSGWVWSSPAWAPFGARGEVIAGPGPVVRQVVTFYRVGDAPLTGSAARVKLETMKARLLMRDQRAVVILVSAEESDAAPADSTIRTFLRALGNPEEVADAAIRTR